MHPANGTWMQTAGTEKNKNVVAIRFMSGFASVGWTGVRILSSSLGPM